MNPLDPTPPASEPGDSDLSLAELIEALTRRVQAGEALDLETLEREHPHHAEALLDFLPVLGGITQLKTISPPSLPTLGDFRLIRQVGQGGMGIVYEAVQQSLSRRVAVKVLPPQATLSPAHRERFRREAEAAGRLHHSHIVPVFGVGEHEGVSFYVMQFIEGQGLYEARPRAAAKWIAEVAEALDYAHRHGVLHRDIKPSNLMVDGRGHVWLTDFGLARLEDGASLTHTGDVVGTLRYMAPERFHSTGDARSDVYSLGLTLYELLTHRPAFDEPNRAQLLRQITHGSPPRPRQIDPTLSRDLETITLKAIDPEPARRYQTAAEFADDLRRYLADQPIRARPVGPIGRLVKWAKRRPVVAGLTFALSVAALALLALGIWSYVQISDALQAKERERQTAVAETYRALESETRALRLGRPPGWRARALENIKLLAHAGDPKRDLSALRQEAVHCLGETDGEWMADSVSIPHPVLGMDRSADGQWLAVRTPTEVVVIDAFTGDRRAAWPTPLAVKDGEISPLNQRSYKAPVCLSPDGTRVAYATFEQGVIVQPIDQPPARPLVIPSAAGRIAAGTIAWGAEGKFLAVAWLDKKTTLYDSATGAVLIAFAGKPADKTSTNPLLALAPTSPLFVKVLGSNANQADLHRFQSKGIAPAVTIPDTTSETSFTAAKFSPDEKSLVLGGEHGAWLYSVRTPPTKPILTARLEGHSGAVRCVAFSAAGDLVATGDDKAVRVWNVGTGTSRITIPSPFGSLSHVSFDADGSHLLVGGFNQMRRFRLTEDKPTRRVLASSSNLTFQVHPRLARAAVVHDHGVQLLDVSTGRAVHAWDFADKNATSHAAFSSDSERLAACRAFTGMKPRRVHVWEVASGREVHSFEVPAHVAGKIPALDATRRNLGLVSDLLSVNPASPNLSLWNLDNGQTIWTRTVAPEEPSSVKFLTFSATASD